MTRFKFRPVVAALAAALPLSFITTPGVAQSQSGKQWQQPQWQQTQPQSQNEQSSREGSQQAVRQIREATKDLQKAQRQLQQAQSRSRQARQDAEQALNELQQAVQQAQRSGGQQAKQAAQEAASDIENAQQALKQSEQQEQLAQALGEATQSAQNLQQQIAQGGSSAGKQQAQSGKQQAQSGSGAASQAVQQSRQAQQQTEQLEAQGQKLVGKDLYGSQGEQVGEIQNVVVKNGKPVAVLVDVGGFLGIGDKTVAIPIEDLQVRNERVTAMNLTKETAEAMPEYNQEQRAQVAGIGQGPQDGGDATVPGGYRQGAPSSGKQERAGQSAQKLSQQDKQFVEKAARGNIAEIQLGKLVQEKAQSQQVKQFGERLVRDHTQAREKLQQILGSTNIDLPSEPSQSAKQHMEKLRQLSGDRFDAAFLDHAAKEHKDTIDMYQKQARSGENRQLQSFAENTLPTLKEHLQMARSAEQTVGDGSSTGTESGRQKQPGSNR